MTRLPFRFVTVLACITFGSLCVQAQNSLRSWVSGVGVDNANCGRSAPCRTLAHAISVTKPNGEINILDPAGFGTFTIDRSITINATGTLATVQANIGQSGILITLNPTDTLNTVRIRGLAITGMGDGAKVGLTGIHFTSTNTATNLKISLEDVVIDGFVNDGITYSANGGDLVVKNLTIRNNNKAGIRVDSSGANPVNVRIDHTTTNLNQEGVRFEDNVRGTITNSDSSNNTLHGYVNIPGTTSSEMNIDHSTASHNKQVGVFSISNGAASTIRISDMEITNNGGNGLSSFFGGQICSNGKNRITAPTQVPNCTFTEQ